MKRRKLLLAATLSLVLLSGCVDPASDVTIPNQKTIL